MLRSRIEQTQQWIRSKREIQFQGNGIKRERRLRTWLQPAIDSSCDNCCAASSLSTALTKLLIYTRDSSQDSAAISWRKPHASVAPSFSDEWGVKRVGEGREMRHCMLLKRHKGGRRMNNNADCGMMSLSTSCREPRAERASRALIYEFITGQGVF